MVRKQRNQVVCEASTSVIVLWRQIPLTITQTVNFFRKMIEEVDLTDLQASKSGEISSGYRNRKGVVDFDPMKRKLETTL